MLLSILLTLYVCVFFTSWLPQTGPCVSSIPSTSVNTEMSGWPTGPLPHSRQITDESDASAPPGNGQAPGYKVNEPSLWSKKSLLPIQKAQVSAPTSDGHFTQNKKAFSVMNSDVRQCSFISPHSFGKQCFYLSRSGDALNLKFLFKPLKTFFSPSWK